MSSQPPLPGTPQEESEQQTILVHMQLESLAGKPIRELEVKNPVLLEDLYIMAIDSTYPGSHPFDYKASITFFDQERDAWKPIKTDDHLALALLSASSRRGILSLIATVTENVACAPTPIRLGDVLANVSLDVPDEDNAAARRLPLSEQFVQRLTKPSLCHSQFPEAVKPLAAERAVNTVMSGNKFKIQRHLRIVSSKTKTPAKSYASERSVNRSLPRILGDVTASGGVPNNGRHTVHNGIDIPVLSRDRFPSASPLQRKILGYLAFCHSIGIADPPKWLVSSFAGYTNPDSAMIRLAFKSLKDQGYIECDSSKKKGARLKLACKGILMVGDEADPPKTENEAHRRVKCLLTDVGKVLYDELLDGDVHEIESLARAQGYTNPGSAKFRKAATLLKILGLAEAPTSGTLRLTRVIAKFSFQDILSGERRSNMTAGSDLTYCSNEVACV